MADGAVNFLLEKLTALILQKASLLGNVKEDVEEIKQEFESMRAFLKDANRRKEISNDEGIGIWVRQVRDVAYEVEDFIDEFMHHKDRWRRRNGFNGILHHTVSLPKIIISTHQIATKLPKLKAKVHGISERSKRYDFDKIDDIKSSNIEFNGRWQNHGETSLFVDEDEILGMEENKNKLLLWLSEDEPRRTIISIVGMGGLGKTTLVTKVYNDQIVKRIFDCWAWVSVSQTYRIEELLLSMIKEFIDRKQVVVPRNLGSMNYRQLVDVLISYLHDKRYVIVLGDVWSIDLWSKIRGALPNNRCRSRIILTTRNENVASSVGMGSRVHHLQPLLEKDAWSLFCRKSFWRNHDRTCPRELKEIAKVIVKKCEGLPLAIVAMGGLMSSRDQTVFEWKKVHDSLNWQLSNNAMLERVKAILLLSFNDLPFYLKHCFLYCSVFRDGHPIKRKKLIRLWVAEGFIEERKGMTMEEVAEDYLKELIFRSMLQITETNDAGRVKTCRLHDFMRELALTTSEKENFCTAFDARESRLDGRIRRLSIYNSGENIQLSKSMSNCLRSFLLFQTETFPSSLPHMLTNFKLLRVLDLQGASVDTLPDDLVGLISLRYLNLRETRLRELPKSIGKLQYLQTLDVRNTNVESLPSGITKLSNLRHLYVYHYKNRYSKDYNFLSTMKTPVGMWNLQSLQTLACIEADETLIKQVGNLSELRRFEVAKLRAGDGPKLCSSIEKMCCLLYLGVMASNDEEPLHLEVLSPPTLLQKLTLVGHLQSLPLWLGSLMNLTHLCLGWSRLGQDMLSSLQVLSNLVFLELKKAYEGQLLHFHSGYFPRLNKLNLWELTQLNCVIIEEGALPSIRLLYLIRCAELKILPTGIEHLTGLEKLHLEEMPEEFVQKLHSDISEDRWNVRRITTIKHVFQTEQNLFVETLL
ncbi:Disease resistance protein [Macleaya cordata]|uniref:Disease resistance protein n=1 Tax=Macleaya cordata TaxID=56857 RepID=A0A200RBM1_MACCD|nr:Disease resistance protein [Macleaya cordata]